MREWLKSSVYSNRGGNHWLSGISWFWIFFSSLHQALLLSKWHHVTHPDIAENGNLDLKVKHQTELQKWWLFSNKFQSLICNCAEKRISPSTNSKPIFRCYAVMLGALVVERLYTPLLIASLVYYSQWHFLFLRDVFNIRLTLDYPIFTLTKVCCGWWFTLDANLRQLYTIA